MEGVTDAPTPRTVGQLRESGHVHKSLRVELRDNLLGRLASGVDPWPGLHGFDTTVIPQLERAIIAGHKPGDSITLTIDRGGSTKTITATLGAKA